MSTTTRVPASSLRLARRDFLRAALAGAGIYALGPLSRFLPEAQGAPMSLKRFIVINAAGGNDTLNMVIPVNLAPYYSRRPSIAIPAASALPLAGTSAYKLHPAMPRIQALWNEGAAAVVHRVGYPTPNLSHFESQDIFSFGVRGGRNGFAGLGLAPSGWIARYADHFAPTPMGAVALGQGRPMDFTGGQTGHLQADSLAAFKLRAAGTSGSSVTNAHLLRLQTAKDVLTAYSGSGLTKESREALLQAHDLAGQVQTAISSYTTTVTWPSTTLGRRMKDIAVLVQGGFDSRIFYTGFGGFDTHSGQGTVTPDAGTQAALFVQMDNAIGAFADDMKARGVWNDIVIVVITEFGRRNYETGTASSPGTDHGHAWTALLVGGGVNGGVFGPDLTEADLNSEYPTYAVDFRSIYKEILANHLAADPVPVFPEPLKTEQTLGIV